MRRPITPLDLAGRGLDRAGDALTAMYTAMAQVLPLAVAGVEQTALLASRGLLLLERAVIAAERLAAAHERLAASSEHSRPSKSTPRPRSG